MASNRYFTLEEVTPYNIHKIKRSENMTTSKGLSVSPFDEVRHSIGVGKQAVTPVQPPANNTADVLNEIKGLRADVQKGFEVIGGQIKLLNDLFQKYDSDYVNTVAADGLKPAD